MVDAANVANETTFDNCNSITLSSVCRSMVLQPYEFVIFDETFFQLHFPDFAFYRKQIILNHRHFHHRKITLLNKLRLFLNFGPTPLASHKTQHFSIFLFLNFNPSYYVPQNLGKLKLPDLSNCPTKARREPRYSRMVYLYLERGLYMMLNYSYFTICLRNKLFTVLHLVVSLPFSLLH